MNEGKEDPVGDLVEAFPRLFKGEHPTVHSWVPSGWRPLVTQLFRDLNALLTDDQAKQFRIIQIKEKFAELRVYWSFGREEAVVVDLVSEDGRWKFTTGPDDPSTVYRSIDALVRKAGLTSMTTCDVCGADGQMYDDGGWARTRCSQHAPAGAKVIKPEIR